MNNLIYLAISGFITVCAGIFVFFILAALAIIREAVKESKEYKYMKFLSNHKRVTDLRRYHAGGFIREHKREV